MSQVLAIAAGGALGSVLRFWMSTWVHAWAGRGFPYGTLAVNVLGCLAIGLLFVLLLERVNQDSLWRAGLLIGLLGGFTTFSSFSLETLGLMNEGLWARALTNVVASVVLCLMATWLGIRLGRLL